VEKFLVSENLKERYLPFEYQYIEYVSELVRYLKRMARSGEIRVIKKKNVYQIPEEEAENIRERLSVVIERLEQKRKKEEEQIHQLIEELKHWEERE
jgi:hypothetical protein